MSVNAKTMHAAVCSLPYWAQLSVIR